MSHRVEQLAEGKVSLLCGDCLTLLSTLEANSIDSCVTDPPYELNFMNRKWDGTGVAFKVATWKQVFRVLKPGAYIVAFSSSRTYHRMACAIEDAGFITHPLVGWITGQGFPKAHSVSKHIDRMAGVERFQGSARVRLGDKQAYGEDRSGTEVYGEYVGESFTTLPATDLAREWDGWFYGTQSLKPAIEPIYVGQKPFEKGLNGTQNILKWGVGALNIGGCRVEGGKDVPASPRRAPQNATYGDLSKDPGTGSGWDKSIGRWPANVIHDGSDEVVGAFPKTSSGSRKAGEYGVLGGDIYARADIGPMPALEGSEGSAARFFYTAKADSDDRLGSKHPTVKPLDLMQYLVRLVTPPKGLVLDLFAGTGTTGEACLREDFRTILIEREEEYQEDIRRRMRLALTAGPQERAREAHKARNQGKPVDAGPLFG